MTTGYSFRVKQVTRQRIVVRAVRASLSEWGAALEAALDDVWRYLNTFESVTVGPAMAMIHECGDGTAELAGGFPVAEAIDPDADHQVVELPAGPAGTTLLVGPYERLPEAHAALADWLQSQNRTPVGDPWLIFWATPDEAALPGELRTELVWPLGADPG
ncbi:MAG: GyrI-like domain-containing protein [Planctomycetes bacterium]|nr:GyrI-like domain-containing protein [Planctomycetota bacterium]